MPENNDINYKRRISLQKVYLYLTLLFITEHCNITTISSLNGFGTFRINPYNNLFYFIAFSTNFDHSVINTLHLDLDYV